MRLKLIYLHVVKIVVEMKRLKLGSSIRTKFHFYLVFVNKKKKNFCFHSAEKYWNKKKIVEACYFIN
jgi:hypothetical protein